MNLYLLLIGAIVPGRNIEQHDVLLAHGNELSDLVVQIEEFWPGANCHIDGYCKITHVDGFDINITNRENTLKQDEKLFFINLGGYKPGEFEEYHYKMMTVAFNKSAAIQKAKATAFYKHTGFDQAKSHIDDKYGVDIDDLYEINDLLSEDFKSRYSILLSPNPHGVGNDFTVGYFALSKLKRGIIDGE
jgi:hypothetical protein